MDKKEQNPHSKEEIYLELEIKKVFLVRATQ